MEQHQVRTAGSQRASSSSIVSLPSPLPLVDAEPSVVSSSSSAPAQWSFPVDRVTVPLYAEGRDTMLCSVKCWGRGGLLDVQLSHCNIVLGNVPRNARRRDEIVVSNKGDVPVQIQISAINSDLPATSVQSRAGTLTVECLQAHTPPPPPRLPDGIVVSDRSPSLFSLSAGQSCTLLVELDVNGSGGPFSLPFRLNLLGTTIARCWHLSVSGFVDDIRLSVAMESLLLAERLESLRPVEVGANAHLARVIAPLHSVPSVSIHHQLAAVEPTLTSPSMAPLHAATALPSALAPAHLHSLRRWYHGRAPLRLTVPHADPFDTLRDMLADRTVERRAPSSS
jgi:hypothetical protein